MRCGPRSLSCFHSSLPRDLRRVDRVAKQSTECILVFEILRQIGHRRAHGLRTLLDALTEFTVGQDVEFIVENSLQHPLAYRFLRHVEMKEVAALLTPLVGL